MWTLKSLLAFVPSIPSSWLLCSLNPMACDASPLTGGAPGYTSCPIAAMFQAGK